MKRLILTMAVTSLVSGPAFAGAPNPEEWYRVFDHFIGTWVSNLKMDGEVHRWEINLKRSATGRCQVLTVTVDGEPYEQGLYGYDPRLKCWRGTVFWASGRLTTELYRMDAYKAIKAGHGEYKCESFGTNIDGSEYKESGTFTIVDENTFSMKFVTDDGHVDDGVFRRQGKKP